MTQHPPSFLLGKAGQTLRQTGDRDQAIQIAREAIAAFSEQSLINSETARNSILRLGLCRPLIELHKASGGLSWQNFLFFWDKQTVCSIMQADGLDFLDLLVGLGAPQNILRVQVKRTAQSTNLPGLAKWMVSRAPTPEKAVCSLLDILEDYTSDDAREIASLCQEILPKETTALVRAFKSRQGSLSSKTAAICVVAGASCEAIAQILDLPDLPPDCRRILALGKSAHGRLEAMRREPDLPSLIERSPLSEFCTDHTIP